MKKILLACLLGFSMHAFAQERFCDTKMTDKQMQELRKFQQAGNFSLRLGKTLKYVPVKFHIAGLDNGVGYYPASHLLAAIARINKDFAPLGLYFYMKGDVDYINNTTLYHFDYSTYGPIVWQTIDQAAVNIYFVGTATGICGVYMGGDDIIVVLNSCQKPGATTLTHELGHFFGLPHTFSGWEWGTPSPAYQENADGTNCRDAGDGFCDTRADYLASRWNCPYSGTVKDPKGVAIDPDGTLFMSYADDGCMNRFSNEQFAAMDNNLGGRGLTTSAPLSDSLPPPMLISPANNDSNLNNNFVTFRWTSVPGVTWYNLQVINWKGFNQPVVDLILKDTFMTVPQLPIWRDLYWRVKSITPGFTASEYSQLNVFYTGSVRTALDEAGVAGEETIHAYPNPSTVHEAWNITLPERSELLITDIEGKEVHRSSAEAGVTEISFPEAGCYFIRVTTGSKTIHLKQVVTN